MNGTKEVLFLNLYTFSLTGGIEKVCRTMAKTLHDLYPRFSLMSLHDQPEDADDRYMPLAQYHAFRGGRLRFAWQLWRRRRKVDILLLSHIHLLLFARLIRFFAPQTRIILLAHGIEVWRDISGWKKTFLQEHTEIWAVSRFTAAKMQEQYGLAASRVTVLNNALDPFFVLPQQFDKPGALLERYGLDARQPVLLTLTRLSSKESYKGYDRVLQAMAGLKAAFPDLHYILAGKADASEQARIQALICELELEKNVTLTGFIAEAELSAHYQLADVFVMPSTHEGFGIAFIEAAACGIPLIGGNVDGSVDALLDGELGQAIDPSDIGALTQAIASALPTKKDAPALQQRCLEAFSFAAYLQKVKTLLMTVPPFIVPSSNA